MIKIEASGDGYLIRGKEIEHNPLGDIRRGIGTVFSA